MAEVQWSGWQLSDLHKLRGFSGLLQGRGTVIIDPSQSAMLIFNRFQHISTWILNGRCLGFVACLMNCKNTVWRKWNKQMRPWASQIFFPTPEAHRQMWCPNLEDGHQVREADQCTSCKNAFNTNMARKPSAKFWAQLWQEGANDAHGCCSQFKPVLQCDLWSMTPSDFIWCVATCCHDKKAQQLTTEANQQTMTWRSADRACHRYALCRWRICPQQDRFGRIRRGRRCAQNSAGRPKNLLKRSSEDAFTKEKHQKFDWDTSGFFIFPSRLIYLQFYQLAYIRYSAVGFAAEGKLLNFRWRPDSIFALQKK